MKEKLTPHVKERFLFGKKLFRITSNIFKGSSISSYMLCDLCWEAISEQPDDLHKGYSSFDGRHYFCEECFNKYYKDFQWMIDGRIKDVDDFDEKLKLFNRKTVMVRSTKTLDCEKECGICQRKISKNDAEGAYVCTEDEQHFFCKDCAKSFSAVFSWKQKFE